MITICGMLSQEDVEAGFSLVLDDNWYALLLQDDDVLARFDPRDYTSAELLAEAENILQTRRGDHK